MEFSRVAQQRCCEERATLGQSDNLTPFPLVPIFQTDPEALSPITIRMPANYGFNFPIAAPES
jgi:hypothetical protein